MPRKSARQLIGLRSISHFLKWAKGSDNFERKESSIGRKIVLCPKMQYYSYQDEVEILSVEEDIISVSEGEGSSPNDRLLGKYSKYGKRN